MKRLKIFFLLMFVTVSALVNAQGPPPPPPGLSIDMGLGFLFAAALGLVIKKIKN
ncbi:MAG: hypothetical protein ACN4EF_07150 [Wenyingzhuangia sp.]|jgi:hypothetical protein|uniref:hypothetical protein n=1 Tax=Wenyingzhuangia sp. TaxID=1964193 RepID=UPI00321A6372